MFFPPKLKKGDTVALISPCSPPSPAWVRQKVSDCVEKLQQMGFHVWQGESLMGETPCGYSAAPDEVKLRDLHHAFASDEIQGIWCIRGGSTASRLLPQLDYELIAAHPKPFVGLSDITALQLSFAKNCGFVTYHGPVARYLAEGIDEYSMERLWAALEMENSLPYVEPEGYPVITLRSGKARGEFIGGNLSLVSGLVGTPYLPGLKGRILFLEEVGESVYRIERMMMQLKYAGILDAVEGIVFGDFVRCRNAYREDYGPAELLRDFFQDYPKPVLCNVKAGHGRPNATLPLGAACEIGEGSLCFYRQ